MSRSPASLPLSPRHQLNRRILYQAAQKLVPKIESTLDEFVAPDATIVVAHEGLQELLRLHGRTVLSAPRDQPEDGGGRAGRRSSRLAREGADVLVVPSVSLWWNDAFNALQPAIRDRFQEIASTEACTSMTFGSARSARQFPSMANGVAFATPSERGRRPTH